MASVEKSIHKHLGNFEPNIKIHLLVRELAQSRLEAAFERVYATIFGTQIDALRQLVKEGGSVSIATAEAFFENVKSQFPEFYEKANFQQWYSFIKNNGFVDESNGIVTITPIGTDFLSYLNARGLPENRPW